MTCCNVLLINFEWQTSFSSHHLGIISRIKCLPLKAVEFYDLDTMGFLKNFEVLMYFSLPYDLL